MPLAGFENVSGQGPFERGPSTIAIRSDGRLVVGTNRLDNVTGNLLAVDQLFTLNPRTGLGVPGGVTSLPTGQPSRSIARIVAAPGNRVYVVGTAGPGRFGHDRVVVGRFSDGNRTVTVSTLGSGGTVSSSPSGITNCGGPGGACSAGFPPGSGVTLTAMPLPSNRFGNWGGGFVACGTSPVCTFTVGGDVAGEAVFIPTTSVSIARVGSGGIASTPGGLVCGITPGSGCSGTFDRDPGFGNQTTFTATPAAGWRFANWTGDFAACGTNPVCAVVLNQPGFSATANFAVLGENIFANGFEP